MVTVKSPCQNLRCYRQNGFYLSITSTDISILFCSAVGSLNFPFSVRYLITYRINHGSEKKVCCKPKSRALCKCGGVLARILPMNASLSRQNASQCFYLTSYLKQCCLDLLIFKDYTMRNNFGIAVFIQHINISPFGKPYIFGGR